MRLECSHLYWCLSRARSHLDRRSRRSLRDLSSSLHLLSHTSGRGPGLLHSSRLVGRIRKHPRRFGDLPWSPSPKNTAWTTHPNESPLNSLWYCALRRSQQIRSASLSRLTRSPHQANKSTDWPLWSYITE